MRFFTTFAQFIKKLPHKKFICAFLIVVIVLNYTRPIEIALGTGAKKEYKLVALLVEKNMLGDLRSYEGMKAAHPVLAERTIRQRVERYAQDIQKDLPFTKTVIIPIDSDEQSSAIAQVLEKLYFDGLIENDEKNILAGIVLIGDVPLPAVNKNGNSFLSLYPYTDFEDKAYIFSPKTNTFELNTKSENPVPEIWHGVITSPIDYKIQNCTPQQNNPFACINSDSYEKIASFLDKNHLYHQKLEGFGDFDPKMLFADTNTEQKLMSKLGYANYMRYINHIEDRAYLRYTKELAEQLYTEVEGELEGGDAVDNDGDGKIDEDPINGKDDDGDTLIDEDDGNPENTVDNDDDGQLNEDTRKDNNGDNDNKTDEDGPGDMDEDGCPGECEKDDDRDCKDVDKDGIRSYMENTFEAAGAFGPDIHDAYKKKSVPFPPVVAAMFLSGMFPPHSKEFCTDEAPLPNATSCYEAGHEGDENYFHPEWDDDEDGQCDEDGTSDNDNDGDGLFDEDAGDATAAPVDESMFADLPDVQSKNLIDRYFKKYYELFEKHLGTINNLTDRTGRYSSAVMDADGLNRSEVDSLITLVSKKDELVTTFLRAQNDYIESQVDKIISEIQNPVPLIGRANLTWTIKFDDDDDPSTPDISVPAPAPLIFINHSVKSFNAPLQPYILGTPANKISSADQCSLFLGSYCSPNDTSCQKSKLVEANRLYDPLTSGSYQKDTDDDQEAYPDDLDDGDDFGGCFGNNIEHRDWCFPDNSIAPIKSKKGTHATTENIPVDYRSCFDFKEGTNFLGPTPILPGDWHNYLYYAEHIGDVTWKLGKDGVYQDSTPIKPLLSLSGCCGDGPDAKVENESQFDIALNFYKQWLADIGARNSPYLPYTAMPFFIDSISGAEYSLADILTKLGYDVTQNQILSENFFANGPSQLVLENPYPRISQITLNLSREYVSKIDGPGGIPMLTPILSDARTIPSTYSHKEPTNDTIMQQSTAQFTRDLPIDSPRYTTFRGSDLTFHKFVYPNLFSATSVDDFRDMLVQKDSEFATLPDANSYTSTLQNIIDTKLNKEMIEDAITWRNMTTDEKHSYILSTYMDKLDDPFLSRPTNGYEIAHFIGTGDSEGLNFSFNGDKPEADEDYEWTHARTNSSDDVERAALAIESGPSNQAKGGSGNYGDGPQDNSSSNSEPAPRIPGGFDDTVRSLPLADWMDAMSEWVQSLSDDYSFQSPEALCGECFSPKVNEKDTVYTGSQETTTTQLPIVKEDKDIDGIPDEIDSVPNIADINHNGLSEGEEATVYFTMSANKKLLNADGHDIVQITVEGMQKTPDGDKLNSFDSQTQVTLDLKTNEGFIALSPLTLPLIGGRTTFRFSAPSVEGTLKATVFSKERPKLPSADTITVKAVDTKLKLFTYQLDTVQSSGANELLKLENIIFKNEENITVARLGLKTQQMTDIDSSVLLRFTPAKKNSPQHASLIEKNSGREVGTIILPALTFDIKNEHESVKTNEQNGKFFITKENNQLGRIEKGYVYLNPDLHYQFSENKLNDILVSDDNGTLLFEITLTFTLNENSISLTMSNSILDTIWQHVTNTLLPHVFAQNLAPNQIDSDRDGLKNFEEYNLHTNIEKDDTDGDSFSDKQEILNGYDPLRVGEKLFTDLSKNHRSFSAVLTLLLRGILSGYEDHTFRPDKALSREEFVKINSGANCIDCTSFSKTVEEKLLAKYALSPFPDQNISESLSQCIAFGKNENIVSGYASSPYTGFFMPKTTISRAEAIKVLMESTAHFQNINELRSSSYTGADKPWYFNYVIKAQSIGLLLTAPFTIPKDKDDFNEYFNEQIKAQGDFVRYLNQPISRAEFSEMAALLIQTYDCTKNDQDLDGLSDQSEIYQYGTIETDDDTDDGGVKDGEEVLRNLDPLDLTDDARFKPFTDLGEVSETDLNTDTDNDGLNDLTELGFGSNKNEKDTDHDGLSDGDEYLLRTDPNTKDTFTLPEVEDPLVSGLHIENETVTIQKDLEEPQTLELRNSKELIPVSEETNYLVLEAQVLNSDGSINVNDSDSIVEFSTDTGNNAVIENERVQVFAGIAKTKVISKTNAGNFHFSAKVIGKDIAGDAKNLAIYPLEPVTVSLNAKSTTIQAGVISTTDVVVSLKDKFNNLTYGTAYPVDITINGPGELNISDEDTTKDGTQIIITEGKRTLQLKSIETPGTINITANYSGLTSSLAVKSEKEIKFDITHSNPEIIADGASDTIVNVRAINAEGTLLAGYNETVTISVSDQSLGILTSGDSVTLKDGVGTATFRSGMVAGTQYVSVSHEGALPSNHSIEIQPLSPSFILVSADDKTLFTDDSDGVVIRASVYDKNGNFVANDSSSTLIFTVTTLTNKFGTLDYTGATATQNGEAKVHLLPTELTGPVHIIVRDTLGRLTPGTLEINAATRFDSKTVNSIAPNALFTSFLGDEFGNPFDSENLANTYLQNGKTQATISLTVDPNAHSVKSHLSSDGRITDTDTSYMYTDFIPAGDQNSPSILALKDIITDRNIIELVYKFNESKRLYANIENPNHNQHGIFLNSVSDNEDFKAIKSNSGLSFTYKNAEVVSIKGSGQIFVIDKSFSIHYDDSFFAPRFEIIYAGVKVGEIIFNLDLKNEIQELPSNYDLRNFSTLKEGCYIIPHLGISSFELERSVSGNSSALPGSYVLRSTTDTLPDEQKPGGTKLSLENAGEDPTIGFGSDNKLFLHFASGEILGEALRKNPSEIAILYGDPTISLAPRNVSTSGFDKTMGQKIYETESPIKDMTTMDYDGNKLPDLLLSFNSGELKLIKNRDSFERFESVGDMLFVANGIASHDIGDFDDNGYDDIIVVGEDTCNADSLSCIDMYMNDEGTFRRVHLDLKLAFKAEQVKTADMDGDGDTDIVVSDAGSNITVFYNEKIAGEELFSESRSSIAGGFGVSIDTTKNLKDEILIDYSEQKKDNKNTSTDDTKFAKINDREFMKLQFDDTFSTSKKIAFDVNGGTTLPGDIVRYSITLTNNASQKATDVIVSDLVSDALKFNPDSVSCDACDISMYLTNDLTRPFIMQVPEIGANSSITISYDTTLKSLPEITFGILPNASEFGVKDDKLPDIAATVKGNPSGIMTYFYSDYKNEKGVKYSKHKYVPTVDNTADDYVLPEDGINRSQDFDNDAEEVPDDVQEQYTGLTTSDLDNDGLPNMWDQVPGPVSDYTFKKSQPFTGFDNAPSFVKNAFAATEVDKPVAEVLDKVAGVVEDVIAKLTCGGGCFAIPVNISFLTPGQYNMFGIPVGFDNGTPVFCWGATNVSTVGAGSLCETSSGGRLYLSPTLNGGLVFAMCLGPKAAGQCFSFNIPLLQALGVCDKVNGAIEAALSKSSEIASSTSGSIAMSMTGSTSSNQATASGGMVSVDLGNYSVPSIQNVNTRISGFPSVFTDWLDRQTEELGDVLDLPDIYFVYPDPESMLGTLGTGTGGKPKTLYDALNYLNSLPLIDIKSEEITLKLPSISMAEIETKKQEAEQFVASLKSQIDTFTKLSDKSPAEYSQSWGSPEGQKFINDLQEMVKTIEQNMLILEEYSKLPYQIMEYRYAMTKYVAQIVCYVDAIIKSTAGYVVKNQQRVKDWVKAIQDIVKSVKTWQDLIQLSISYQESCDKCTTSRLTLTELMMKLFVFIPSPPIVDLPKWPDIVLDISDVQAGVQLYFPELKIVSEPITLPDLPKIYIPQEIPGDNPKSLRSLQQFLNTVQLPKIPVLPEPPKLPNLPTLPGLPMPRLPDIPPPPEFPELPEGLSVLVKSLEKVIKILCLVKNGFIPTSEGQLKTKAEELTARSSDIILPIDKGFSVQSPDLKIDLVDRIEIRSHLNLKLDIKPLKEGIEKLAEGFNTAASKVSEKQNYIFDKISDLGKVSEDKVKEASSAVDNGTKALEAPLSYSPLLDKEISSVTNIISRLNKESEEFSRKTEDFNKTLTAKGDMYYIAANDPILARPLNEISMADEYPASPYITNLVNLKHNLISYGNQLTEENTRIAKVIGLPQKSNAIAGFTTPKAITQFISTPVKQAQDPIASAQKQGTKLLSQTRDLKDNWLYGRPLASNKALDTAMDFSSPENPSSAEIARKGIFIYNKKENISEKLINYDSESGQSSNIVMSDFDNDGDEDIIYTLGREIYYKQNYTKGKKLEYYKKPAKIINFDSLLAEISSVNNFKRTTQNQNEVRLNWLPTENAVGYEVELNPIINEMLFEKESIINKLLYFDEKKSRQIDTAISNTGTLTDVQGDIQIFSNSGDQKNLTFGDRLETSGDSHAILNFSHDNKIYIGDNTAFTIPEEGNAIEVEKGGITLLNGNNFFKTPGTELITKTNAKAKINLDKNGKIEMNENTKLKIPEIKENTQYVYKVDGDIIAYTHPRKLLSRGESSILEPSKILSTLSESTFTISSVNNGSATYQLSPHIHFLLPSDIDQTTKVEVKKGSIELIDKNSEMTEIEPYKGMLITADSKISAGKNSEAVISYTHEKPYLTTIQNNETIMIKKLSGKEMLSSTLELPEGNYYAKIFAINTDGHRGTSGKHILLSPQTCGDKTKPVANAGSTEKDVPIFKTLELNLNGSQDSDGSISEYYFDLNLEKDNDHDGDPTNDADSFSDVDQKIDSYGDGNPKNDKDNPKLILGPYKDLAPRFLKAWVKDKAGNTSGQEIKINVFAPDISLSPLIADDGIAQGSLNPKVPHMPFKMIRKRENIFTTIKNKDGTDTFYTDEKGAYNYSAFSMDDTIVVKDETGEVVGKVNSQNGRINLTNDKFKIVAKVADTLPTRIELQNAKGTQLSTTYLITDDNTDATIEPPSTAYTAEKVKPMNGVHITPYMSDNIKLKSLKGLDPSFPGGVEILKDSTRIGIISPQGNIYFYDPKLTLNVKEAINPEDPYVLTVSYDTQIIADVYTATDAQVHLVKTSPIVATTSPSALDSDHDGMSDSFETIHNLNPNKPDIYDDLDKDGIRNGVEAKRGTNPNSKDTDSDGVNDLEEIMSGLNPTQKDSSPFKDLSTSHPLYQTIVDYYHKGILKGYTINDGYEFRGNNSITRAEFTKIMLKILCIEPREESYLAPNVFSDIEFSENNEWYYPILKEASLRNFVTGYLKEKNSSGQTPFKPYNSINFAETIKIIEEVLSRFETPDGTTVIKALDVKPIELWYAPYIDIAVHLSDYLIHPVETKKVFLLTEEEAKTPQKNVTRFDFAKIAQRVLNVYSCYDLDKDGDKLSDLLETQFGTDPNSADTDSDGIQDSDEILYNLSPLEVNEDVDQDGLSNIEEIKLGTDMFNADSDFDSDSDGIEVGNHTDPLNKTDNQSVKDNTTQVEETLENRESGIYIETTLCTTCPCPITVESSADIRNDDIIFTAITGDDIKEIHSLSDPVTIDANAK